MATLCVPVKELDDITECPICAEVYTDPRVLPCGHTFCLKCVDGWCQRQPQDSQLVTCPLCRNEFSIPSDGITQLPRNFFIEKLFSLRELAKSSGAECDGCLTRSKDADGKASPIASATVYCVDCQQKLCERCQLMHEKSHRIVKHCGNLDARRGPSNCQTHPEDALKIYCYDCKLAICMVCCMGKHKSHNCSDIHMVSDKLRRQLEDDLKHVATDLMRCHEMMAMLLTDKNDFIDQISKTQNEICSKADELKLMIDKQKDRLTEELETHKFARLTEMERKSKELEGHLVALECFNRNANELLKNGTPCEIVAAAGDLRHTADDLLLSESLERPLIDYGISVVTFESSDSINNADAFGRISFNTLCRVIQPAQPSLTHVLPMGGPVRAVTSLGNDVFVVRDMIAEVEIYDTTTLTLNRRLLVPGLGCYPYGLAACPTNNCIYVSDWNNNAIHKVALSENNAVTRWSVGRGPAGLSLNSSLNILVTYCYKVSKIHEYTTDGIRVREIRLNQLGRCWHALQLPSGQLVVSEYTSPGRVHLMTGRGQITQSCEDVQLMNPTNIVLTRDGSLVVADSANNRIVVFNRYLARGQPLPLPTDGGGLQEPWSLCLDGSRDRLYVGECRGGRLLVFDHISDVLRNAVI